MRFVAEESGGALQRAVAASLAEATGREARDNPVLAGTGGPAGNALLTAWTALVLLGLSVAELLTLFDVRGLISWHVALGALLIPPAALKTASTGWRMLSWARALWFTLMVVGAAALAVVLVHADTSWAAHRFGGDG